MTEQTIWLVMERGFEYNDETYDYQEGGNVQRGYASQETANQAALERTKEQLKGGSLGEFLGYDWRTYLDGIDALESVDDEFQLDLAVRTLNDKDLTQLARNVSNHFFYVEETMLEA